MPQRYGEGEIELAKEQLRFSRHLYWCLKCARPRKRNYCPAAARTDQIRHETILRNKLTPEQQLEQYLYQGQLG